MQFRSLRQSVARGHHSPAVHPVAMHRVACRPCAASLSAQPEMSPSQHSESPSSSSALPDQPNALVSIDTGDAIEKLTVPVQSSRSTVVTATLTMPMGMVVEESEGLFVVAEVAPGSSAAAKGVREGDIVRAVTAASMQMTYPTMNLMLGGVGRPKLKRIALGVSGRPFAWLREAIRSNGQLPGNAITVVLERPAKGTGPCRYDGSEEVVSTGCSKGLFDPRIFE